MKKFALTTIYVLFAAALLSQTPKGISHQAVIRNAANELVTNSAIGIQVSILQGSPSGNVVYSETHAPSSNANGLVSFVIGQGAILTGIFNDIDWAAGPYFIKTEADPTGGNNYNITGTSQIFSIPYAFHAETAENIIGNITENDPTWNGSANTTENIGRTGSVGIGTTSPHPSAKTEINSTTQGFLPPRMTTAQMNAISSPAPGLMVYNNSLNSIFYYNGNAWINTDDGKPCGTVTYSGKVYSTILIGTQCWMAQNLNVGTRINGTENQTNNGTIEKYCYNNQESNCDTYGGLYQWDEMMQYSTTPGVKGICPEGWHLPSDTELWTLTTYLNSQTAYCCDNNTNAIAKSLAATTLWSTHTNTCAIGNNLLANNATGFSGLPGGYRGTTGLFFNLGNTGYFWSSNGGTTYAWSRELSYNTLSFYTRYDSLKGLGLSVRCLKD